MLRKNVDIFRHRVKAEIKYLDDWLKMPHEGFDQLAFVEYCAWMLDELALLARDAGLPEAVRACRQCNEKRFEGIRLVAEEDAQLALAACLAAIPEPEYDTFTPGEIAKQLKVSEDTVLSWIRSSELKASNIASRTSSRPRWIVRKADLDRFLKNRQPEPAGKRSSKVESSFNRYST